MTTKRLPSWGPTCQKSGYMPPTTVLRAHVWAMWLDKTYHRGSPKSGDEFGVST